MARRCSLGTSVRTVAESAAVMPRRIRASPGVSPRNCPSMRRVADAGSKPNESRALSPASPALRPVQFLSRYPVARNPSPRSRRFRPSIRPWPAISNTPCPARRGGSKAPTVPRSGSPSILIPSAPGCASSASIGEATGPRAAIKPDRSERSVGNACEPNRSSDRNGPATRKTISLGQLELEGILRFGLDRNTVQLARTHLAKGTSGSRAELGIDGPESLGRDW